MITIGFCDHIFYLYNKIQDFKRFGEIIQVVEDVSDAE